MWWMHYTRDRHVENFLSDLNARPPISKDDFISRYFANEDILGNVAVRVRHLFAKFYGVPEEKILPDDEFSPKYWADDLDLENFVTDLEKKFGVGFSDLGVIAHSRDGAKCLSWWRKNSRSRRRQLEFG